MTEKDKEYLYLAIDIAKKNIECGGGPFGSVIVKDDEIISSSGNRVVPDNDPTAHAEVSAIRKASSALGTFDLSGCIIYASCEPCPMCLGAIYWSGIRRVVFSSDRFSAAAAGFSDEMIYREINLPNDRKSIEMFQGLSGEGEKVFDAWDNFSDKVRY
jgi:guanine deaminase